MVKGEEIMKQKYSILFLAVLSAVFSCVQVEEGVLDEQIVVEKVAMTFTATIEKNQETKTELGGDFSDALRKVYWQPGDKIGVTTGGDEQEYAGYPPVEVFTSTASELAEQTEFEGSVAFSNSYNAFYPYSTALRDSMGVFIFELPQVQKYVKGSFDPDAAPMVAKAALGEKLQFKNLCGILGLQLKGTGSVQSITFIGRDVWGNPIRVSGRYSVDMKEEDYLDISPYNSSKSSVTLECSDAVALSTVSDTPFYIVLPPETYNSFVVLIKMSDGKVMIKEGKNPLTIKRTDIARASSLSYVETVAIDLSERGNSNCYIVSNAGLYSFDASIIGNREFGIIDNAGFHTDDVRISPSSVSLLWEDRDDILLSPSIEGNRVNFIATGREGNALLAVKDEAGKILWSWHIWVTDKPQDQIYVNDFGTFTMLDRNLGAIHNASDDWENSRGLTYQWGRKDPFTVYQAGNAPLFSENKGQASLAEAVENPTVFEGTGYRGWVTPDNRLMWHPSRKTIYDPCPVGYRVPSKVVWRGFLQENHASQYGITEKYNVSGGWNYGWNFITDGANTAYYPVTHYINSDGYSDWRWRNTENNYMWSSEYENERYAYSFNFYYVNDSNSNINLQNTSYSTDAYAVRCMKDEGYVDTSLPTVHVMEVTDKTSSSAKVVCEVTYPGSASVIERGFIWSPNSDFTSGTRVACGSGSGKFSMTVSGLEEATRYFVKPYATNKYGTTYGAVKQFFTPYSGSGTNLSDPESANCYMIYPTAGIFYFDSSVKGNSSESMGSPASAELLWAVDEYHNASDNIVHDVVLDDNLVFFRTDDAVVPGNALIAVKDDSDNILWSWHIWVVDYDPSTQNHTYYSGAVMMDRNLGASASAPEMSDFANTWKPAAGVIYQWGRKDPLLYESVNVYHDRFSSVEESVQSPATFAAGNEYWLYPMDEYLWKSDTKTMYDPCPAGWRVSPKNAWDNVVYSITHYPYGAILNVNDSQSIWVGYGPYMHSGGDRYENAGTGYTWTSEYNHDDIHGWTVRYGENYWDFSRDMNATDAYPVRCMKEN